MAGRNREHVLETLDDSVFVKRYRLDREMYIGLPNVTRCNVILLRFHFAGVAGKKRVEKGSGLVKEIQIGQRGD